MRTGTSLLRGVKRNPRRQGHPVGFRRSDGQFGAALHGDPVQALDPDAVALRLLRRVHHLQAVDVLHRALVHDARQGGPVTDHIDPERRAPGQTDPEGHDERDQDAGVDNDAGAEDPAQHLAAAQVVLQPVLGHVANQALLVAELLHDAVAHVDTGGAADALVLQALADVDAGGANLDTQAAVHAGAQTRLRRVDLLGAWAARLATLLVVADDQRVLLEHRALEAGVGAHVLAHLLAHVARIAVGGKAIEQHPEPLPGAETQGHGLGPQRADGGEVADEGEPGPQTEKDPDGLLGGLAPDLVQAPAGFVELHALGAIAFDHALKPHGDLGVHRLRAGVAAPQTPCHRGEQEQRVCRDHQQRRQVDQVLRIEDQSENVEAARGQLEQHRLTVIPLQPGAEVEDDLGEPDERPAPLDEQAGDGPRVDLLGLLVERYHRLD